MQEQSVTSTRDAVFVVKLRDVSSRMWGNQVEIRASSALEAAEMATGERPLLEAGIRNDLRARVWATPFGSRPDVPFYRPASDPS